MPLAPVAASGLTNGQPLTLTTSAQTIHTSTSTAGAFDRVRVEATSTSTSPVEVTLNVGASNPTFVTIPPRSGFTLILDHRLSGGAVVSALAATTSVVKVIATVDRYTA